MVKPHEQYFPLKKTMGTLLLIAMAVALWFMVVDLVKELSPDSAQQIDQAGVNILQKRAEPRNEVAQPRNEVAQPKNKIAQPKVEKAAIEKPTIEKSTYKIVKSKSEIKQLKSEVEQLKSKVVQPRNEVELPPNMLAEKLKNSSADSAQDSSESYTKPIPEVVLEPSVMVSSDEVELKKSSIIDKVEVPPTSTELAAHFYLKSVDALRERDNLKAESLLRTTLEYKADHIGSLEALSALLLSIGHYEDAELIVEQGRSFFPENYFLLQIKARLLMRNNLIDDASILLEQHLPDITTSPELYVLLASIYQKQHRYEKAGQFYQSLLRLDPSNGIWEMGYAIALESMGRKEDANTYYKRALNSGRLKAAAFSFVQNKLQGSSKKGQ